MRKTPIIFTFFIISFLQAQDLFVSSMRFKGDSDGDVFQGRDFKVTLEKQGFMVVKQEIKDHKVLIAQNKNSLSDLIFSADMSAVAATLRARESADLRRELVLVNAQGETTRVTYDAYEMTDEYGWIVELGAVSNDGIFVLAKCARVDIVGKSGSTAVRHIWCVLRVEDGEMKIVNSIDSINKWNGYLNGE